MTARVERIGAQHERAANRTPKTPEDARSNYMLSLITKYGWNVAVALSQLNPRFTPANKQPNPLRRQ